MNAARTAAAGLLLASLLLTGCRIERRERETLVGTDSIMREEIRATSLGYRQALLAGQPGAAAAYFSDTARVTIAGSHEIRGVDDIRRMLREGMRDVAFEEAEMSGEVIDIADRGVAWEEGEYSERFRTGEDSAVSVRGRYALRWTRGPESSWQIDRLIIWHEPVETPDTSAGS